MSSERVLLVGDDPKLQQRLWVGLLAQGFQLRAAHRGEDALLQIADFDPTVVLLAMWLPDISGVETCRCIREWSQTPVLMLGGEARAPQTVEALDAGADDLIAEPFTIEMLLARIRAVLRRTRQNCTELGGAQPLTFRNLVVDLVNRKVQLEGRPIHLTPTEYALLWVLATHAGQVLTHRELLTRVWGAHSAKDTQYLHVFVPQLRRKLEPHRDAPHHILTEPGVGYCFSTEL